MILSLSAHATEVAGGDRLDRVGGGPGGRLWAPPFLVDSWPPPSGAALLAPSFLRMVLCALLCRAPGLVVSRREMKGIDPKRNASPGNWAT